MGFFYSKIPVWCKNRTQDSQRFGTSLQQKNLLEIACFFYLNEWFGETQQAGTYFCFLGNIKSFFFGTI